MIVGIDLGTTNSLIAVWNAGEAKLIPNSLGKFLTPSVISVSNDGILIGEPALSRMVTHPELTISNFKRVMGSNKVFKLGDYNFRAEELSALILKRLKEDAEAYLGVPITEAIISVPAYFSDAQRKATKLAGKLAGLTVERLMNEPTAAGVAYGLNEAEDDSSYLIFDLGGGTFDVSILSLFSGIMEVRSSCGDNLLGGIDFTSVLEKMFTEKLTTATPFTTETLPAELQQKITEQAEIAKHHFSLQSEVEMKLQWQSESYSYHFTSNDFATGAEPLLERLRNPIIKALRDANLAASQIQQVVMVGGASRMSLAKKTVANMFGKLPLCHINPDTVIALGCAIQAGLKENNAELAEIVVIDVCPYSLGTSVHNAQGANGFGIDHFDPIIERNCVIPTSKSRVYHPATDTQQLVRIAIYQGENFFLEKNIFLGELNIDLPVGMANRAFEIRFTYDINGMLEVEVTLLETQTKKNLVIEGNNGILTELEIQERLQALKALKVHPREKTENLLALAHAERLYIDLQGDRRAQLGSLIQDFVGTLESQDEVVIAKARTHLTITLESVKNEFDYL